MHHQIELTDTQAVILSAACAREHGAVFPVAANLKGGAVGNVCKSLLKRGLIEEVRATDRNTVWRHDEELGSVTLRATPLAYEVLGIAIAPPDAGAVEQADARVAPDPSREPQADVGSAAPAEAGVNTDADADADSGAQSATGGDMADAGDAGADNAEDAPTGATVAKLRKTRDGSKQAALIAMLRRPEGATIDEIAAAFSWQSHTVRGAIAGTLKKKLGLHVTSEKIEGGGRIYKLGA